MILNFPRSRVIGINFLGAALQPLGQFVAVGKNSAASASRYSMNGKSAVGLPAFDGALGSSEEGGNLLPRIQTPARERVAMGCHKGK
jgi:hypothetical protein